MFGLFARNPASEIVQTWSFHGAHENPGALTYSRHGAFTNAIEGCWMLSLAISKTLYTVSDDEFTAFVGGLLCTYADNLAQAVTEEQVPSDASLYATIPDPLDATHGVESRQLDSRDYGLEYVRYKPNETPRLKTTWPERHAQGDVLSIFRVLAQEYHAEALRHMDARTAHALHAFLLRSLGTQYKLNPRIAQNASLILEIPTTALGMAMDAMKEVIA